MKKTNFFMILAAILFCITAGIFYRTNSNTIYDTMKFKKEYEAYNNKSVNENTYLSVKINGNNQVIYLSEKELLSKLDNETAVFYFGFPTCPWCRNVVEPLLKMTKENNIKLYYFNPSELRSSNSDTYQKLINKLKPYLMKNANDKETLYVPDVYFVKNGNIVGHHLGTVEEQKNPYVKLTNSQLKKLENIYYKNIKKMK